jgi:hypothetical protein
MTADLTQLNVRVPQETKDRLVGRAAHRGMSVQAYVSHLVESDVNPDREHFVSGLVDDMSSLLAEFDGTFGAGSR